MQAAFSNGHLTAKTLVWKEGFKGWQPLQDTELYSLLQAPQNSSTAGRASPLSTSSNASIKKDVASMPSKHLARDK
jgi:hypothetical protein